MQQVPEAGSPMEILAILVWFKQEEIKFQASRANLQALLSQRGVEEKAVLAAFEDLKGCYFPYLANQVKEEKNRLRRALDREVSRGPLVVVPQTELTRPAMRTRLSRGQRGLKEKATKLTRGTTVNIDHQGKFQTGRKRLRDASSIKTGFVNQIVSRGPVKR